MEEPNPDPNPDIEVDDEASAKYTEYRDLGDFESYDTESTIQQLADKSKEHGWKEKFATIDDLRRVNKFHKADMENHIHYFTEFIVANVDNLRSSISRNSLLLVNEIFQTSQNLE
jgi:hypothetical protein